MGRDCGSNVLDLGQRRVLGVSGVSSWCWWLLCCLADCYVAARLLTPLVVSFPSAGVVVVWTLEGIVASIWACSVVVV